MRESKERTGADYSGNVVEGGGEKEEGEGEEGKKGKEVIGEVTG